MPHGLKEPSGGSEGTWASSASSQPSRILSAVAGESNWNSTSTPAVSRRAARMASWTIRDEDKGHVTTDQSQLTLMA